tara:strand:- start:617 stop:1672 length:1056 start_codon:yes stop_codon:yes gene_type:complete
MQNERYYLLDIARGIAAFSVAIFHYRIFYDNNISLVDYNAQKQPFYSIIFFIYEYGWMAVQFFFILSGFIFYILYSERVKKNEITKLTFFKLRFSRLYPLHFITLLISVLIFYFYNQNFFSVKIEGDLKHLLLNLFLIHEWGFSEFRSFNEPSWSISIEALLYSVFFIVFSLKKNDYAVTLVSIFLGIIVFFINKWIGYAMYCFFVGGLTCLIYKKIITNKKNLKLSFIASTFFIVTTIIFLNYTDNKILIKIATYTFLFPSIIINLMIIQVFFNSAGKFFSIIGDISYSVYLIHFVFQIIVKLTMFNFGLKFNFNSELIFLIYLFSLYIISFLSFRYFEIPMQRILRNSF